MAKLDAEIAAKIAERQEKADPESDIDSQFEAVADFLDAIRYVVEADEVFEKKYGELTLALDQAKAAVAARKSEDEDEPSFFESVPRAMQREQQGGRSIFSDVDE